MTQTRKLNFAEIEFYKLCAEFARENNNTDNQN